MHVDQITRVRLIRAISDIDRLNATPVCLHGMLVRVLEDVQKVRCAILIHHLPQYISNLELRQGNMTSCWYKTLTGGNIPMMDGCP